MTASLSSWRPRCRPGRHVASPTLPTPGFLRRRRVLGTRLTGPRPAPPESCDWLLKAPVFRGHCGLVRFGGEGRTSRSRGRAGTRMCVVAAAEELQRGAERPMDEEDAAAPVGGDRGRGPGGLGLCRSRGGGPGRPLRAQGGVRGSGSWRSSCRAPSPVQRGLWRRGVAALTG